MEKYVAKLDFQTVASCKKALEVYKAILKVQLHDSDYEMENSSEYKRVCEAYEAVCKNL